MLVKSIFKIDKNPEGDRFLPELNIVSEYYFEKKLGNLLSIKALQQLLKEKGIDQVSLCGIDEAACIMTTAKGALKNRYKVEILADGIDTIYPKKVLKCRAKLRKQGVIYK